LEYTLQAVPKPFRFVPQTIRGAIFFTLPSDGIMIANKNTIAKITAITSSMVIPFLFRMVFLPDCRQRGGFI
jgi:hypothetical protein